MERKISCVSLNVSEGFFRSTRGYELHYTVLSPLNGNSSSCIVFHHGLSDHSGRHIAFLSQIALKTSLTVLTYDCHGHGCSPPFEAHKRAYVQSPHHLVEDYENFVKHVVKSCHGFENIFAFGYSMGGMTVILAALKNQSLYKGVLLTSALTDCVFEQNPVSIAIKVLLLRFINYFIPTYGLIPRRSVECGIRDPAAVQAMKADALWYRGKLRVGTALSLIDGCKIIKSNVQNLKLPIFAQHATHDVACDIRAFHSFCASVGSKDICFHIVNEGFHDLHHDPETSSCLKNLVTWLHNHS